MSVGSFPLKFSDYNPKVHCFGWKKPTNLWEVKGEMCWGEEQG